MSKFIVSSGEDLESTMWCNLPPQTGRPVRFSSSEMLSSSTKTDPTVLPVYGCRQSTLVQPHRIPKRCTHAYGIRL